MLLVKADQNTEAGVLPSKELVAAMGQFNEEMVNACVLLECRRFSVMDACWSRGVRRPLRTR